MKRSTRVLASGGIVAAICVILAICYGASFGIIALVSRIEAPWWEGIVSSTVIGLFVGGIPSGIIGTITGWILAFVFERKLPTILTPAQSRRIGLMTFGSVVAILNLGIMGLLFAAAWGGARLYQIGDYEGNLPLNFWSSVTSLTVPYAIFIGVPSLIFILAGWWLTPRIYRTVYERTTG